MNTLRQQLHEELLSDTRQFCVYCGKEKSGLGCCGEVHYVTYSEMYEDHQQEMLDYEVEQYEERNNK